MYILIAGGGKVGANLASTLLKVGHEVTLLDNDRHRYSILEEQFEHIARYGDATELYVLERPRSSAPTWWSRSPAMTRTT